MRKYFKTKCLEAIQTLEEAHGEIAELVRNGQAEAADALLEQCQQGAVEIGNLIESSEGEGAEEVKALEQYCELLWQVHEDIANGKTPDSGEITKLLREPLRKAMGGIKHRLPTQREVVFLPYQASMWDSLESVWRRMEADPDITAIVMPIPYYEKNPDGSFRVMHDETNRLPADVPVTKYTDYSLADRHPEAIYIHNPYDDANYITSVHPAFYSSKLKEYTDELVYIPYYVLPEIDPSDKNAVQGVAHYITVPGVVNAHRVIVQSENWRLAYIQVLTEMFGGETRPLWEKKIESSVSPKLERVRHLTEADYLLPDEWKNIVTKPDGSRKKIILYNTGVTALLEEGDRMLDKIERNFTLFREYEDSIALLWRPHPLIEATLTSMRPQLWGKYKDIVDRYKAEHWGIYDDSADLDRAIAVSDAYYGDHSSVVTLYQETGKPVMIQNAAV